MEEKGILKEASNFVFSLFKQKLSKKLVYHNYKHTFETVNEARELGKEIKLSDNDMEALLLAAWFHDTGYVELYQGHEQESAKMARQFLQEHQYPEDRIAVVESCILATKHGSATSNTLQELLVDADMSNIGKDTFFSTAELLRVEWEIYLDKSFSNIEWAQFQLEFLLSTSFKTAVAQRKFAHQLGLNIQEQRERLNKETKKQKKKEKKKNDTLAQPKRGIETMFRTTYRNHINLSGIADNKANIMISLNAIIMSIVITYLGGKASVIGVEFTRNPVLLVPVGLLLITTLGSIIFAIISAQPEVTSLSFNKSKIKNRKLNLLFFGNFTSLQLEDFQRGMHDIMQDKTSLYNNMITDIYYLGELLDKKYKLLRISYAIFMIGLILTVVSFIVVMVISK
ncbi:MAG: DUF5706 domain-containing protein [Hymenobacteraceae bacterium]|nr:DUF5706 domain-containing protein [Hymenobacteraceae bacterium]MDX5395997.1 DUF5706 domain-containing protein [Hymenobacteraceae bacterium]MDX5444374.1 DUF5706 domain-containing protein [Hymenobacteraceae bacterium]MDX5512059.1 DUF5706 domain-containing protein [Hymenobacteraceae bacterium]